MNEDLRVTMVATGLGNVHNQGKKPLSVVHSRTGTDDREGYMTSDDPAVLRTGRRSDATVAAMRQSGVDPMDIPAFLRRQAD